MKGISEERERERERGRLCVNYIHILSPTVDALCVCVYRNLMLSTGSLITKNLLF